MSCDVSQYLPSDDSVDDDIERIVHSRLRIARDFRPTGRGRSRRRFRPKEHYDLQLESDQGNVVLLKAFRRRGAI